jgi:hypothetical protein
MLRLINCIICLPHKSMPTNSSLLCTRLVFLTLCFLVCNPLPFSLFALALLCSLVSVADAVLVMVNIYLLVLLIFHSLVKWSSQDECIKVIKVPLFSP